MVIIPLTQGKTALIDDEDADMVSRFKWHIQKISRNIYAKACIPQGGYCGKQITLHALVMRFPDKDIDHINGNGLDCRKINLREATQSQNSMNQRTRADSKTGFRGVSMQNDKRRNKPYRALVQIRGKKLYSGYFKTAREAAIAYNEASRKFFGEYGRRNLIPSE